MTVHEYTIEVHGHPNYTSAGTNCRVCHTHSWGEHDLSMFDVKLGDLETVLCYQCLVALAKCLKVFVPRSSLRGAR